MAAIAAALLAGCAAKETPYVERPVHEIYNAAVDQLQAGNYAGAAEQFDAVERQHPYSSWATKEQISDVSRDQANTETALNSLLEVVRRFPNTRYARDATLKIDLTRDHLAGKEMAVGRYYLRRREFLAAINRFRRVIDDYQTTTHVPEALHRIAEAYESIGLPAEAKKAAAVLGHNYPGSEWYQDSYGLVTGENKRTQQANKGFFSRAWDWMF
jgi:outer membrane protein assembly factor BamD